MPKLKPKTYARYVGVLERNRWSDTRLARHFKLKPETVAKARISRRLPPVPFPRISPLRKERIIFLRRRNYSFNQIALKTGIFRETVKSFLAAQDVRGDPFSGPERFRIIQLRTREKNTPEMIARETGHSIDDVQAVLSKYVKRKRYKKK